nr:adenylosuccinate synthetase [Pithovirus mammoth]
MSFPVTAVIGTFFGDEGKGKLVDYLASTEDFSVIARSAGGSNSAHTISNEGQTYTSHLIPSGILSDGEKICLLGNGMVIDLAFLLEECKNIDLRFGISCLNRLRISDRAHIVFPFHKKVDYLQDKKTGVKTTCQGIGPAYSDKISRRGIRIGTLKNKEKFSLAYWKLVAYHRNIFSDLDFDFQAILDLHLKQYADIFLPLTIDSCNFLHQELDLGNKILVECSQACMLDIDHGFYPFVTSSSTCVGGAISGLGLPPQKFSTIGVVKAIVTRVTSPSRFPTQFTDKEKKEIVSWFSSFPSDDYKHNLPKAAGLIMNESTEEIDQEGLLLARKFFEVDASGRPRTCGWFDTVLLNRACKINGFTSLCLNKLDCLSGMKKIKICVSYDEGEFSEEPKQVHYLELPGWEENISNLTEWNKLPEEAKNFVTTIEELVKVPVKYIGTGRDRYSIIVR